MTGRPEKPKPSLLRHYAGYTVMAVLLFFFLGTSLVVKPRRVLGPIKALARLMLRAFGFRITVHGVPRPDPDATYVYMSNHISMFDHFIGLGYIPGYLVGLETHEDKSIPVYGWAARRWGQIFVDRDNAYNSLQGYQQIKERLASGISLLLFPEGYRTRDGKLRPFKTTMFQFAIEAQATVIPVVITGMFPLCSRNSERYLAGDVGYHFGEPIPVTGSDREARDELAEKVRAAMLEIKAKMGEPEE